jgi:transcriptional regulator with XRE-family HTH domain
VTGAPTHPLAECFARNLVEARERAEISQEELGLRAALHRTEVSQLERAKRVARIDTVAKLAGALGVPTSRLLDGIAWNPGEYTPGSFRFQPPDETSQ